MSDNIDELKFVKKNITYKKEDPVSELLELYEKTKVDSDQQENVDDDLSLRQMIEQGREKRKRNLLIVAFLCLLAFCASALLGFLYFSSLKFFKTESIALEISAPEKIVLGQSFDYLIKYRNTGDIDIRSAKLTLNYPKGFILEKVLPESDTPFFDLGQILTGAHGEIKISGRIMDDPASEQKLSAVLNFVPSNFNSEFQTSASYSAVMESLDFDVLENYSASVSPGQKFSLKFKIKNKNQDSLEGLKLQLNYPQGFELISLKPQVYESNNVWLISRLPQNSESSEYQIEGKFSNSLKFGNDDERLKDFTLQMLLTNANGDYFKVLEKAMQVKVVDQALSAYLIVNGSSGNKNVELGDDLVFSAVFKNNEDQDFNDVSLSVNIKSFPLDILDWTKLSEDSMGKISSSSDAKEIVWTAKEVPALKVFKSKQEQTMNFTLPIKSLVELKGAGLDSLSQSKIEVFGQISISEDGSLPAIKSGVVELSVNSNLNLGVKALYYYDDGTPIGVGPLPMQAGQATKLVVFWDLSNDLHELSDLSVSCVLPEYVKFADGGKASAGDVAYDEAERKITWKINKLPRTVKEAHANFSIEVTPAKQHVGQIIKLTGITTVSAKDTTTQDLLVKTKNIITSALESDKYATGDGAIK